MAKAKSAQPKVLKVRTALRKLAKYKFHNRMKQVDGGQPHIVLPAIWPIIQELCTIADASEAEMLVVKR